MGGVRRVLVALIVWQKMGDFNPEPAFEFHLWAVIAAFALVRHGMRRIVGFSAGCLEPAPPVRPGG